MDEAIGLFSHDDAIAWLEIELRRSVALADRCPPGMAIPTCPQWTARDLLEHLGAVHRWTTAMIEARATEPIRRRSLDTGAPTDDDWARWISTGADELIGALRSTPPEQPVWTWGADHHACWWARRQLHEAVVHNADLTLALGEDHDIDPLVAADGICELLDNTPVRLTWPDATPPTIDATVHLHATDTDPTTGDPLLDHRGEWTVTMADGAVTYTHGHSKGDTAVRGPVNQLMLVINRRVDATTADVDLFGDVDALEALLTAAGH